MKRGDSDETGNLEAHASETIGQAGATGHGMNDDKESLEVSPNQTFLNTGDPDLDKLTIMDASDPDLGLTNIGDVGPDDWAADTGPTHSTEEAAPRPATAPSRPR